MTNSLARAGHLGYDISPSHRGKGLGHLIAGLGLLEARKLGIREILAICDQTNSPSRKILESLGGKITGIHNGEIRYRIPA